MTPFNDLKILDYSTILLGPFTTILMANLCADVLRFSSRTRADLAALSPPFSPKSKVSTNIVYLERGKISLTLDLKDPRALHIIDLLLEKYDILIEQFRPVVTEKLSRGYDILGSKYPSLLLFDNWLWRNGIAAEWGGSRYQLPG